MAAADVLSFNLDNGTADVNAGTIQVPTPYPSTWYNTVVLAGTFTVPVNCGTAPVGAPGSPTPFQYTSVEEIIDDQASVLAKAATMPGIGPPMQPATSPTITATGGTSPQNAFVDNLLLGPNPTLSWAAVTSSPAPTYYRIFIYQIAPDASNNCNFLPGFFGIVAQLYTTGTSITIPSGILNVPGAGQNWSYFAAIRPTYEPERSLFTAPFIRGAHEFFVETVTNRFTP
jgi:hypothetical protein